MPSLFREPMYPDASGPVRDTAWVEARIPHRAPMRLVDSVVGVDAEHLRIAGLRHVDAADPVLAGHFPDRPIYPGVLQIEAMGQLGLCLAAELASDELDGDAQQPRVVRVEDARFLAAVEAGDTMCLQAAVLDRDVLLSRIAGQVWVGERLCAAAVMEVYFA